MAARKVCLTNKLELCRFWTMLHKFYKQQSSPEVLQRSYRYAINHPEKVLIFIILIEGIVTGIASYMRAIIQSAKITGMIKLGLHEKNVTRPVKHQMQSILSCPLPCYQLA